MNEPIKITKSNVFDGSNFISRILYAWIFPLYKLGYTRPLEFTDLYKCRKKDEALRVTNKLQKEWDKELSKKNPSLFKALSRAFGWSVFWHNLTIVLSDTIIRLTQPFMLQIIIKYLEQADSSDIKDEDRVSRTKAQLMSFLLVFSSIILQLSRHYSWFCSSMSGNNIRTSLTALIYKKTLNLSKSSQNTFDLGQVINTIASDLSRFEDFVQNINGVVCAPIMSIIAVWCTYNLISESCFVGLAIILLLLPIQAIMGRLFNRYRRSTAAITDKRVRMMSEIITAIKLIKFYCWEEPFANVIQIIRKNELKAILNSYYLKGTNAAFFFIGVRLMLFASFVTYVALGNKLRPEIVYTVMTLYNAIRIPVTNRFPQSVGTLAESMVGLKRVEKILLSDEKADDALINSRFNVKGSIVYVNYHAKWTNALESEALSGVNVNIKPGSLTIIIGSVGSGKTCFLWSLLGELYATKGSINMNGLISYASQEPWCFNGTVKQNILLTDQVENVNYKKIIDVCSLKRDVELFPHGDDTIIGEKGYTLSGGQKARVNLARSVYREADYYLMDDPLSAVDPKVASHIFNQCIKGYLKDKTIILVTHQLQFISKADCIIYMQNGRVHAYGSYDELISSSNDFKEFIESRNKEAEDEKNKAKREKSISVASYESKISESSQNYEQIILTDEEKRKEKDDREEKKQIGSMETIVYWRYFTSGNSIIFLAITLIITLFTQGLNHFIELWMSAWTSKEVASESTSTVDQSIIFTSETANITMYSILIILLFILAFVRVTLAHICALRSAISLHAKVFTNILRAPMLFFETNPSGRILNRFTKDIGVIDSTLPSVISETNITLLQVIGIVVTTIVVDWYMIFPVLFITIGAIKIRSFHLKTARDLQRLDSIARSPVYSHIGETFNGLTTIRAMNVESHMMSQYNRYLSDSIATRFLVVTVGRWIGLILDMFVCIFMAVICIILMVTDKNTISPGDAGVILSNAILLIGMFQGCIRSTVEIETQMISVERILEYGELESEAPPLIEETAALLPKNWPSNGSVEFYNVNMRYSPGSPLILNNVSFVVEPGEKIGIVGRTGAGKSSLITALFRLVELESGKICLDHVDIAQLGLKNVRRSIFIIPQDPSLFSGSIRRNLDPFNEHNDDELWRALREAHLLDLVQSIPGKLDGSVTEGGANLSVGQRQLLCLARALLRNNSILVLDEATANVDHETDESIQMTIRNNFADRTVLTIAHRLNTIIDMDKVLVMASGRVIEYDEPHILLQNSNSEFYSMIKQTGADFEKQLHHAARIAYEARKNRISRINFGDD